MQVECPVCHIIFQIDESKISDNREKVGCPDCQTSFFLKPSKATTIRDVPQNIQKSQDENIGFCPNCGFKQIIEMECVKCGIVFFKYAAALEKAFVKKRPPKGRPSPKSDIAELNYIDQVITVMLRIAVGIFIFFIGCIPYGAVNIFYKESIRPSAHPGPGAFITWGVYGLFSLLLLVGLLYLCWRLPSKIIPPIRCGLKNEYIKKSKDKLIIIIGGLLALIMSIFPPFLYTNSSGVSYSRGYYFILSAPNHFQIDITRLFVQWVITAIFTFVAFYFIKEIKSQKHQS